MHIDTKAQRDAAAVKSVALRKVVWSSMLGSTVEWYDFTIYGTAAALVFNKLFFPNLSPAIGVIAAFGSYATGFLARPLGGAVFGHFGDRIGRKAMLSMTIILVGAGTFLIGCLPTYGQIGIAAPLLLVVLRIVQGIGIGGEWGGAVLMVIESAPNERRGFYGSLVQLGYPLAVILATAMFALVSQLPEREFLTWGWRVPFLLKHGLLPLSASAKLPLHTGRLKGILGQLDHRRRNVVEFRHKSWWNKAVYSAFRETGSIFCSCSGPGLPDELIKTADDIYIRLHGTKQWYRHDYTKEELRVWANRIEESGAKTVSAYFNSDRNGYAIKNASALSRLLQTSAKTL